MNRGGVGKQTGHPQFTSEFTCSHVLSPMGGFGGPWQCDSEVNLAEKMPRNSQEHCENHSERGLAPLVITTWLF